MKFVVTDQEGNVVFSGEYSALSYARSSIINTTNTDLINLCKAMVLYNRAAKVYFS